MKQITKTNKNNIIKRSLKREFFNERENNWEKCKKILKTKDLSNENLEKDLKWLDKNSKINKLQILNPKK